LPVGFVFTSKLSVGSKCNSESKAPLMMRRASTVSARGKRDEKHAIKDGAREEDRKKTCYEWISLVINKPFEWVCWATVLPVENEEYSRARAGVFPIFGVYFIIWCITKEFYSYTYLYIGLPLVIM